MHLNSEAHQRQERGDIRKKKTLCVDERGVFQGTVSLHTLMPFLQKSFRCVFFSFAPNR